MGKKSEDYFSSLGFTGLIPDPLLTVTDWADRYRVLSQKASAEPGFWRTSRTPFLKEIMDELSVSSPTQRIVFMKGAQVGGTEAGLNWLGYVIDYAPGPFMMVQPNLEMAERSSRQRIEPLIESCDRILEKVGHARSRDSRNKVLSKDFPGGLLVLTGANSATGLRSLPARYIFCDEVDAYPGNVGGEGDPILLAEARARTFGTRKKIFLVSTPTVEGRSRIEREFLKSDQRYYFVPCARCGEFQWLQWNQVKYERDEEEIPCDAWYECELCHGRIEDWEKTKMFAAGQWRRQNPKSTVAGFHLSSLYSPVGWLSWCGLAKEWSDAQGNPERLQSFFNTSLGQTWKDKGEAPSWKRLYEKRESYPFNEAPDGVLFLVAGVDIQPDRIECEIVGYGRDKESWSIDYRVIHGDTSRPDSEAFRDLIRIQQEVFKGECGHEFRIKMMAVDSGFNTQAVYAWVRQFSPREVIAVKGRDSGDMILSNPRKVDLKEGKRTMRRALNLFNVNTSMAKEELYRWLRHETPDEGQPYPYGYCHFPEYGEDYFKQLTAEELQKKFVKGFPKFYWEKIRDRNEALDTRVYARAAAAALGIDRYKDTNWSKLEALVGVKNKKQTETPQLSTQKRKKVTITRRKSNFL